jgi:hypothetical protein
VIVFHFYARVVLTFACHVVVCLPLFLSVHTYLGCCISAGLRSGRLWSWTYGSVAGVVIGLTGHCRGSVLDRVRVFCESCCILSSVSRAVFCLL